MNRIGQRTLVLASLWWFIASATSAGTLRPEFILPGTQPNEHDFEFRDVANCVACHSGTTNGAADPYFSWQGGMMAQAARDPVFRTALAIANQDLKGSGEFCIRCHAPRAWFEGRSTAPDASLLKKDDLNGVSCDVCHHLTDPLSDEAKKLAKQTPPGYGNGMMVSDFQRVMRGPYQEAKGLQMHPMLKSPYHASSELCGNCHNVSNPTLATNVNLQPPYAFGHIERTYSEWALSDFAKKESLQSCQICHFPPVLGGGKSVHYQSRHGDQHRDYFVSHNAVGGSTWVQQAVYKIWKGKEVDRAALNAGIDNARALLKKAAALGLEITNGVARVTVTNLTGHKLPTGYPEGRRMWLDVLFLAKDGKPIQELGAYGETASTLLAKPVNVPTLLHPETTRVYECKPGLSEVAAAKCKESPGPSFHFILNDVITKDNRIPPRGFRNAAFAEHLAAPVGASYADGQFWDLVDFPLPKPEKNHPAPAVASVEVRLMYQSVSWEYLKFLVERNETDDWGEKLYDAWLTTGKCQPEIIATITRKVPKQ